MKTYILSIFIFCCAIWSLKGQNLVPNPSFEVYDTCPWGQSQIKFAVGWSSYSYTPDYFNSCDDNGQAGVPFNVLGFQNPRTGNAYAGFYAYAIMGLYREFIGTSLIQQLIIGKKYYVTFYVNTAFNPNPGWHSTFAVNKLGARFTTVPYTYSIPIPVDNFAQIYTDSIISDTVNWVKISGSFIADSAYRFVSFGNFFTDSATTHISLDTLSSYAYYFIDDIIVSPDSLYNNENMYSTSSQFAKLYPNPAHNIITIEGTALKSYTIIDMLGRKYKEAEFADASQNSIYVGDLPKGMYFVAVKTLAGSWVRKVVIQ